MNNFSIKEAKISIVVPVYNVKSYISRCIDSLVCQTYNNLEIILVDDGSNDGSGDICDEYSVKDNRIKVIHKLNGGLSDARNKGIEQATGDYLLFVDSDDWIALNTCQLIHDMAQKHNADVVVFGVKNVFESGKIVFGRKCYHGITDKTLCIKALITNIAYSGIYNYACNKMFSRSLFEKIRFPLGKLAEDQDVIYRVLHKSKRIYVSDLHLYNYYRRSSSITSNQYYPKLIQDRHELWVKRLSFFEKYYPELVDDQIAQILGVAYVSLIKLDKSNKNLRSILENFVKKYGKNERLYSRIDKKVKLHYYCFPLFWLYVKFKIK